MKKVLSAVLFAGVLFAAVLPFAYELIGSITDPDELRYYLGAVLGAREGFSSWAILPQLVTMEHYVRLLLASPAFHVMFWNSVVVSALTALGQFIVGVPAAWSLSQFDFKGRKGVVFVYLVLMMLPFQAVMLSNYVVLNALGLTETLACLIIPGVFSTLPVFVMYSYFKSIPNSILDAARIDGASELAVLFRVGLPVGLPGVMAGLLLGFFESWNMVEQPLAFLTNESLWPLSMFFPQPTQDNIGIVFAASVVGLIPPVLVFLAAHENVEDGISKILGSGRRQ